MPHGGSPAGTVFDLRIRGEPIHGDSGATSLLLTVLMPKIVPAGFEANIKAVFYDKW
jgi:hypothetical protein